ncbi:MAG: transporter transrane protein [Chloroflexi bacterium]|nr:transporter transrane protein [Chloroflexota bacterium]
MTALARFQARVLLRGRAALVAAGVFALAAGLTTVLGLGSFRQVGLGAVGPAAAAIVNLAILLPTAQAILLGALGLAGDRESGFAALLRARGVGPGALVVATWWSVTAAAWLSLGVGFGLAALVIAGNVPLADLPTFAALFGVMLVVAAAAAAIGVLVGAAASSRLQAALGAVAAWFVLAIGLDLVVLGLGVFVRLGEGAILAAVAIDPFTSGRLAALLLLDAGGGVLGPVGQYLVLRLGAPGAVAMLLAVVAAWVVLPLVVARQIAARRDA